MSDEQKIILKGFAILMAFFALIIFAGIVIEKEGHRIDVARQIDCKNGYIAACG